MPYVDDAVEFPHRGKSESVSSARDSGKIPKALAEQAGLTPSGPVEALLSENPLRKIHSALDGGLRAEAPDAETAVRVQQLSIQRPGSQRPGSQRPVSQRGREGVWDRSSSWARGSAPWPTPPSKREGTWSRRTKLLLRGRGPGHGAVDPPSFNANAESLEGCYRDGEHRGPRPTSA